ncbi:hypothetical protein FRB95_005073 [Tulasnella sp. JGI-2019a]|nr:hypothetical protein FRB95_005073 [Tulasnella sp. JGI-2019a]
MKGNGEDAKALAMYIANVTEMTMRPFETKPLDNSPNMKKRIGDLHQVLETIRDELQTLTSRRLRLRVLHYARDVTKMAGFKTRIDEAVKHVQLETVLATGHEVGLVSERQERSIQEQYRISQDLLAVSRRHQPSTGSSTVLGPETMAPPRSLRV